MCFTATHTHNDVCDFCYLQVSSFLFPASEWLKYIVPVSMQHFQGEQTSKHKGKANLQQCQISTLKYVPVWHAKEYFQSNLESLYLHVM